MESLQKSHKIIRQIGLGSLRGILAIQKLKEITKKHDPKARDRALTTAVYLMLLMIAQVEKGVSSVQQLLLEGFSKVKQIYGLQADVLSRQAFSKRARTISWKIFKEIFEYTLAVYEQVCQGSNELYKGIYTIKIIDSTVMDVVARLIGAFASQSHSEVKRKNKSRKSKEGKIKAKFLLNKTAGVPEFVVIQKARTHDIRGIKKLVDRALKRAINVILLFDLGFFTFELFEYIIKKGGYFVSRLRDNSQYKLIKRLSKNQWLVKIGVTARYQKQVIVRLVRVKEEGQWYYYITNLMQKDKISAKDIRQLYKFRWQIELFFKDLKHVMNTTKFFIIMQKG